MEKGNAAAAGPAARGFVDQPIACGATPGKSGVEVGYPVTQVVDSRPPPGEEFRHGAVGVAGLEQLDVDLAEVKTDDRRSVRLFGSFLRGQAEDVAVEGQGIGDAGHRDTDVGEPRPIAHDSVNLTVRGDAVEGSTRTHPVAVSDATFGQEVEQRKGLVLVDFWATWCGPCHMVAPIMDQIATEYDGKGVTVTKMDVDANPQTPLRLNVRSIPSVLFFRDGKKVDSVVGAYPKPDFEQKIKQHL